VALRFLENLCTLGVSRSGWRVVLVIVLIFEVLVMVSEMCC
jgi:hypothetical protein